MPLSEKDGSSRSINSRVRYYAAVVAECPRGHFGSGESREARIRHTGLRQELYRGVCRVDQERVHVTAVPERFTVYAAVEGKSTIAL